MMVPPGCAVLRLAGRMKLTATAQAPGEMRCESLVGSPTDASWQ